MSLRAPAASLRRRVSLFAFAALPVAALAGCYQDPEERIAQEQLMQDMTDAVNQLGMQVSELQASVDSLRLIIAKHDTAVYRMANVTGVPYAP